MRHPTYGRIVTEGLGEYSGAFCRFQVLSNAVGQGKPQSELSNVSEDVVRRPDGRCQYTGRFIMSSSPNRIVATVFGAVYLLVGLLGFAVTGGVGFIATEGGLLLGIFEVNPLHNIAHLLIGAALLVAGLANARAAKGVNTTVGAVYLLLGIVGFFLAGTSANILALNVPDHFLHLASAVVLLGVGLGTERNVPRTAGV